MALRILSLLSFILICWTAPVFAYDYPKPQQRMIPLALGCSAPGMVALTFDDGPSSNLDTVLNTLQNHDVVATFYFQGFKLTKPHHLELAQRTLDAGHQIENHSWDHPNFLTLSTDQIKQQVNDTNQIFWDALGVIPRFVRPPHGRIDVPKAMPIWELGYGISLWNLDPKDYVTSLFWGPDNVYGEIEKAFNNANPETDSFNILLHDSSPTSVTKLDDIILFIKSKGYQFVDLNECVDSGPEY